LIWTKSRPAGLTVDYGWLTVLSAPLFWVMALFYDWTHNWGAAIILLTILIKLLFFPLSAASYRSMAKMRLVAPKLEKIKQQYGDDREQLNRAMMDLYKTEKINPLGGCLPVLIQIPVFIALYWAILASVEMRYAPFLRLDNRSVGSGSILHPAVDHGCEHDRPDAPQSQAARSYAGQGDANHADRLQRDFLLLPRRPGVVFHRE
jgi:YidC/Oxa1 family membrane protein insertase